MRLLIIRHGDPDYAVDGLTEKGVREAELLCGRLLGEDITDIYCSTLGRARLTVEPYLKSSGRNAKYCEWLREFNYPKVRVPYLDKEKHSWDLWPEFVEQRPELYHPTLWRTADFLQGTDVLAAYDEVCREFDALMERYGYVRDGLCYKAVSPSHDTVALVCHFGLTAVILSYIMNCSPYSIWQNAFTAPTSVTTVYTEERREGIASLRVAALGDVSHLLAAGEPAAFSGRFCECFTDETRH